MEVGIRPGWPCRPCHAFLWSQEGGPHANFRSGRPGDPRTARSEEDDRSFEKALAKFDDEVDTRWDQIACLLSDKDGEAVRQRYAELQDDIKSIEDGLVALPAYENSHSPGSPELNAEPASPSRKNGKAATPKSSTDQERRKGIPWTEEEHRCGHYRGLYSGLAPAPHGKSTPPSPWPSGPQCGQPGPGLDWKPSPAVPVLPAGPALCCLTNGASKGPGMEHF
mmetsp:Transcript_11637/g.36868  ORF Transcript_11637/g.36868 Transcript_11637/m.36868 type:complete len:223 (-) Transcript_11637:638-1306(-)